MIYRSLIIEDVNDPATSENIIQLENLLGAKLPTDYSDFMHQFNGGYLDYSATVRFDDGTHEEMTFGSLHQIDFNGEWETNPFELINERKKEGFPQKQVLPIARDGGSSSLFLDLRNGCRVIAFIHGLPEWTGLRQKDSLVFIANSFNDYLDLLHISDEIAENHIKDFDITEESVKATIEWLDSGNISWRHKFKDVWNSRVDCLKIL